MMVDGVRNSVEEIEPYKIAEKRDGPIWGGAFDRTVTRLKTEGEAQRDTAAEKGRKWKVISNEKTNRLGQPRSEEHTSELQSLMRISYAVFCLKKKKKQTLPNKDDKSKKENKQT